VYTSFLITLYNIRLLFYGDKKLTIFDRRVELCMEINNKHTHKFHTKPFIGEISGPHGDEYEDDCLLGCCAV
jgi:hypothetical protein